MTRKQDGREARVLAKPLVQAGIERAPGETVRLRPDQIARLEVEGYFEPVKRTAAKGGPEAGNAAANETKESGT